MIDACIQHNVKKLVFISSVEQFMETDFVPIEESTTNKFVLWNTKLAIEKYLHLNGKLNDLNHVILRLANPWRVKC